MGLGTKIKEALTGDHHDTSTSNMHAPGAYPSDDVPQKHSDGKEYVAPHGSLIDHKAKTGTATGASSGLATSGSHHNKLQKGVDEYDPAYDADSSRLNPGHTTRDSGVGLDGTSARDPTSKGAYWGDLSHDRQGPTTTTTNTRDLPERSRLGEDVAGSTGRHHGVTAGHHDHNRAGAGQAVGGGVYNTVTGTGSLDHSTSRPGQSGGVVHDPLSSGTKGIPASSGNTYNDRKTDLRGDGAPTTRNDHAGLGVAGATAGAGTAAAYGAHEHGHHGGQQHARHEVHEHDHRGHGNTGYSEHHQAPMTGHKGAGVPQTSMLDPEPAITSSSSQSGFGSSTSQPTAAHSASHPTSHIPGKSSPTITSGTTPGGASGVSGIGGHDSAASHFGPGHQGSKVLHPCQHCGRDNDISQYFSKDVVYRLGS